MAQQAPSNPTLPQNDTAAGQAARAAQLTATQGVYKWTDAVPSLPGVPAVATLPAEELPTLEWWLKLVKVVIELAKNQIAVEETLIAQGLAALDPLMIDADKALIVAIEKDVASLEQKIANTPPTGKNIGALIKDGIELVAAEAAIADLKNHAQKLATIIERSGAVQHAEGDDARSLDDYRDVFQTVKIPEIAYTFQSDIEFARLRVAGPNSVLIEAVTGNAVPEKCPISAEKYANIVPNDKRSPKAVSSSATIRISPRSNRAIGTARPNISPARLRCLRSRRSQDRWCRLRSIATQAMPQAR